jgi:hypothetical protein
MHHFPSENTYDLTVAYRIYPNVSKSPFVHKSNKLKLAETGIRTLKDSLGKLRARIFFILDNCPDEYEMMILNHFDPADVEFIKPKGVGNFATFSLQMDILLKQTYSDIVFFAEDDYVYQSLMLVHAIKLLMENPLVDFVTPYDSLDSYTFPIHTRHKYEIIIFDGLHWRTSASSCLTFLTKKNVLQNTERVLRSYSTGAWDTSMWFSLTKYNVFSLPSIISYAINDFFLFKAVALSWKKLWFQILFGRKYKLWQPIPSIGTHMEEKFLAPNVDWIAVVSKGESIQADR